MPRARVHYIHTGPWPWYIGFTTDKDAFAREMKRLSVGGDVPFIANEHSNATTHTFTNKGTHCSIICCEPYSRKRTREQYAAMIAHEATHIIQWMRDDLGDLGKEAEAYLVQQIVQECLQIAWASNKVRRTSPVA